MTLVSPERDASATPREVERLLDSATAPSGRFARVSVPLPAVALAPLCALGDSAIVWEPNTSPAFVGIDAAERYVGSGSERFREIQHAVSRDLGPDPELRVFGGFAFEPGSLGDGFAPFGDACFVLPRFCYERRAASAALSLVLSRAELSNRERAREWVAQLLALGERIATLPAASGTRVQPVRVNDVSAESWADLVSDILARIAAGEASKIVAARRVEFRFPRPLDVPATLQSLHEQARGSTCFAFRQGSSTFLGASPERLVRKHDRSVESEALAGTFRTDGLALAAELLRSPKEHDEHTPVLAAIASALEPLCSKLEYPAQPEMRELPDLLHLRTPINGTLKKPAHVLELVERLHPTPAVGGVPTPVALDWIRRREPGERGWYAGPVGWFDGAGDGDFQVALRSGLVEGSRATLFAGGGIVRGSEPHAEFAETELKLRALFGALRCA